MTFLFLLLSLLIVSDFFRQKEDRDREDNRQKKKKRGRTMPAFYPACIQTFYTARVTVRTIWFGLFVVDGLVPLADAHTLLAMSLLDTLVYAHLFARGRFDARRRTQHRARAALSWTDRSLLVYGYFNDVLLHQSIYLRHAHGHLWRLLPSHTTHARRMFERRKHAALCGFILSVTPLPLLSRTAFHTFGF